MRSGLSILPLVFLALPTASASAEPVWRWDRDTIGISCTLVQDLPANFTPVTISAGAGSDGGSIAFRVRSPRFARGLYEGGTITLAEGAQFAADVTVNSVENRRYRLDASTRDPKFLATLARSETVAVSHPEAGRFEVKLRDSAAAVGAIRTCETSLLTRWASTP